ncbi:M23 family metallopeptidase [Microbacterium sp. JZ31]|uniref:M23 family metallopeptidase n=1 Tax=Microbacterium sp. JZ31 TaxID=1906274 RepID=UPI001932799C|nr:M23 family metallopeptidase [Microbacterium sp. JZ31]
MDGALDLAYPFAGRWLVQNSPADRVPSHGTTLLATSYAIDFVPVEAGARTAPIRPSSLVRPEAPERFPGFGRPILSPVDGVVIAARDAEPDHPAFRGIPSIAYALTQRRRIAAGWVALAGNHVLIERDGIVVALCHLRQGGVDVRVGQRVVPGDAIGRCGNSGNSTEPHLHLQAMDSREPEGARAVPITFGDALPRGGDVVEV